MKHKFILTSLFLLTGLFTGRNLHAQEYLVTGTDLCTDGSQSTKIGLSDSDTGKIYTLYHDGKFIGLKSVNLGKAPNIIDFGSFQEPGKYTVVEFTRENLDFKHPEKGRKIRGTISINKLPVQYVPQKLEFKSGTPLNYQPRADIEGCTFKWTARLTKGKATGYKKSGEGMITDKPELQGTEPACVTYSITPISPAQLGSCMGNPLELVVWILP